MRLILIGAPGSGKGTQGDLLAGKYGVPHISTGAIIREIVGSGSKQGLAYKERIESGNFIPDADIVEILVRRLAKADAKSGYILDGFPRDVAQARLFDRTEAGSKLDAAIELRLSEAEAVSRIAGRLVCPVCGSSYHKVNHPPRIDETCDRDGAPLERRADDEPEAVMRRMTVYHEQTEPVLDHYRRQGKLITVEASGEPDEVFQRLTGLLLSESPESLNAKV